jgi:hypothetical protein
MESGERLNVKAQADQLYVQGQDGQWVLLYAESETRFFVLDSDYRFVFVVQEGKATGLSLEIQGLTLPPAKRVE